MNNRSKIEILFDSVFTIEQVLIDTQNSFGQRGVLQANVDYIKHCLGKEEFIKELTTEQTAKLNKAVADAEARIAILPIPAEELEKPRYKNKHTLTSTASSIQ